MSKAGAVIPMNPRRPWLGDLTHGPNGPHPTVANATLVIGRDADLEGLAAYDEFSHQVVVTRALPFAYEGATSALGPYPRPIDDDDVTLIQIHLQRAYKVRVSQPVTQQAIAVTAQQHRIHPVRSYLDGLAWDGRPRLERWLQSAFGAPDDDYHAAIGTKFLCAAIRRIRQPGVKFDHVLVLEGPQGHGKSRACAALFDHWFTDNLPPDLGSKDAQQAMGGRWGIEMAELQALIKSSPQTAKAFFSRQVDYYRPPYGRAFIERPRQCVFLGSTNDYDWLSDSTGNRRYWPVRCSRIEPGWIADWRDQLWAEACQFEAEGETLWLDDRRVERRAVEQQSHRVAEDVWTATIRTWLRETRRYDVRVPDILESALQLPKIHQTKSVEMRVSAVLRLDGWLRERVRTPGGVIVCWRRPADEPGGGNSELAL